MNIKFDVNTKRFELTSKNTTYLMEIIKDGFLAHVYWGRRLTGYHGSNSILYLDRGFCPNIHVEDRSFSLDTLPQEYPQYGNGDYRPCAYQIKNEHNETFSDIRYVSHEIMKGKARLTSLPCAHGSNEEVETLCIHMEDEYAGLHIDLFYSVFYDTDIIVRSSRFYANKDLVLTKMLSANVDFRRSDFDLISMYGSHNNDRNLDRRALHSASTIIESMRGASSPQQTPFIALASKDSNEEAGDVYAMQFIYSGNFQAVVYKDTYENVRMQMGLQPFDNEWHLSKGSVFETPEVVLSYTNRGFNALSSQLHTFARQHIIAKSWRNKPRPILINSWESAYFNFDEDTLLALAKEASKVGIELFVLDDGWFKNRNSDTSSLGDWIVDTRKLPHGLAWLSDQIHDLGMQFGIWIEPEMISENSDIYRKHPEYAMHVKGRAPVSGRGQLVMDLTSPIVRDYVVDSICNVLSSASINYVKWDMNRHLSNIGSSFQNDASQREVAHRYMLGVYDIMNRITNAFPTILFESCSSGGGRFDLGMLYYMPQTWTSDNTDAICRMHIQYATSYMMPLETMGNHVSSCPNHQTGRNTNLATRFAVAMGGRLGYELDLTKLDSSEKEEVKHQIALYKKLRPTIQNGTLYRLLNPFTNNAGAINIISQDAKEVLVIYVKTLSEAAAPLYILRLQGLQEESLYIDQATNQVYSGSELMYAGISIQNAKEDFHSEIWHFRKEDNL